MIWRLSHKRQEFYDLMKIFVSEEGLRLMKEVPMECYPSRVNQNECWSQNWTF